jgi:hypothetical protein
MKKYVLLIAIFVISYSYSFCQSSKNDSVKKENSIFKSLNLNSKNISYGIKGSFDLTKLYESETAMPTQLFENNYPIPGRKFINNFQIGFSIRYKLNEKFGLILEPGYIQKGTNFKNDADFDARYGSYTQVRLGYVNMPILLYFEPLKKFKLELGAEPEYRVYKKVTNTPYLTDDFMKNNFDLNIIGGASYDIFTFLNVGARYSLGLTRMRTDFPYNDIYDNIYGTQHVYDYNRYLEFFIRFYYPKSNK